MTSRQQKTVVFATIPIFAAAGVTLDLFTPLGVAAWFFLIMARAALGQVSDQFPATSPVLTNISQIWGIPREHNTEEYRIRVEAVIYYYDKEWSDAWGECAGKPIWLPILGSSVSFKAGQRIAIDGWIVPSSQRFVWDKTQVRILQEGVNTKAEPVGNLRDNCAELKDHLVSVEGLIDRQINEPTHIKLTFLNGDTTANAYVLKGTNDPAPGFKEGDFVRMKCVYSPHFDREGNLSALSLWVARPTDIEVIGSVRNDPRFVTPITPIDEIQESSPTNNMIHIAGIVHSHEPGKWVTLWDGTGQVMVQSRQTQPLRTGDRVEAIGYPYVLGVQQTLHGGLCRLMASTNELVSFDNPPFRLVERIRDLNREEARRHSPVILRAVVTWSNPETPFTFVQDASGGIRVANPKWDMPDTSKPGTIVTLRGEVAEGDFVPIVTNAVISQSGGWNLDEGRLVTLEQAMTGKEDGSWVEMKGFVRQVTKVNDLVRFDLSTSSGEFQAWIPASQSYDYLKGSIIRVQGVCSAVSNSRHQLAGIEILTPEAKYIQVEEPAPEDVFAVPFRPLGNLRQFYMESALNRRIRTSGTVVLHAPGRYLYLQDGGDSVFVLSQQQDALKPGDRVEVVGFPGNEGKKFLLREAVYRRIATGTEPNPIQLPEVHSVNLDLEGLLVKAEGTLLNKVEKDGETHLLIQSKNSTFEAGLDSTADDKAKKLQALQLGSRLAVTGVYEVQSDEYGKPRSFLLHLRSSNDVQLLHQPPWWTFARLLWVLLGVLVTSVAALTWSVLISRKNKLLRQAQTELQVVNDKLELRVEERTRELQEQVSAKERARAELKEIEIRFESLFEDAPVGYHELNEEGRITRVNRTELVMLGYAAEEMIGRFVWDLVAEPEKAREAVMAGLSGKTPVTELVERNYRRKDGTIFPVLIENRMLRDHAGRVTGMRSTFQDITMRKRTEEALAKERNLLRALMDNIPDGIYFKDRESRFTQINPALARHFSLSDPAEATGRTDFDFSSKEHARQAYEDEQAIIRSGEPLVGKEEKETSLDGRVGWVSTTKMPLRNQEGQIVGTFGISRDITERKRMEHSLAEMLDFNQKIISDASVGIVVIKASGQCVLANEAAARTLNVTVSQLLNQNFRQLESWRTSGMVKMAEETLATGRPQQCEPHFVSTFGKEVCLVCHFSPFVRGDEPHLLLLFSDITEKKKLEAQLLRSQRMESLGTLAGGIAHDLNNVLAPLLISVQVLKEKITDADGQKLLHALETNVQRGASLVKQVLAFGRGVTGERVTVQPKHIAHEIEQIVHETFPKSVEFEFQSTDILWTTIGDATQLHQVLLNLCVNARDAMPTGGKLSIHMENAVLDEVYADMNLEAKPGPFVLISVTDTGTGIPKEIQDRMFEPFFTTKKPGKGTGLGLSTTLAIVKSHGGFINCYSEPGKGSTFKVYLPANTTLVSTENMVAGQSELPRGHNELVLVVDDEEPIRNLAQRALERFGYRVLLAADGAEALSLYAPRRNEIDVVITDMVMPGMDGPATIAALKAVNPEIKIVGSSGMASDGGMAKARDAGVRHFIPKPYTAEVMLQTLHQVLNGKGLTFTALLVNES